MKKYICIFCGSSENIAEIYFEEAKKLALELAKNGFGLVYGGANVGLMKVIADTVKAFGGEVVGVVTPEIKKLNVLYEGIKIYEEKSYAERKARMAELSSAFIALPGGLGTIDELMNIAINNQFASYKNLPDNPVKPCCIFNVNGFYDPLVQQLKLSSNAGFISNSHLEQVYSSGNCEEIINHIIKFKSPAPNPHRWWEKNSLTGQFSQPAQENSDEAELVVGQDIDNANSLKPKR